jgi:hypothetical protein
MKIKPMLLLPALLLAAGCDPAPLSTFVDFEVHAEFDPDQPMRVWYQFWNRGDVDVHLAACDRAVLLVAERQVNGAWQDATPATCPEGTGSLAPVRMAPGGSGRGQVAVSARGEYRLAVMIVDPENGAVDRRVVSQSVSVR